MTITVTVNGALHTVPADATVASLVAALSDRPEGRGVAVALGGEVVPRGAWASTALPEGAEIEVVHAVQGG